MRLLFAENQPQLRRSAREYALLEYLIRNKGIILSREQIENNLWNYDYAGDTNVVDVYISYLRKKLDGGHEKKLLHITRLEQGTQKLQLETADLSQLVEVLCEEQAHLAPEGTTLAVHTQPDLLVNGDVTLLSRLLANLISNAYRYGKPNGHVWVDLRREGRWAVLAVRDDGIGIAPEDREHIFQRFYQVDAARGKDGSGLGLFMVQQAARLHGGSVTVDSRIGEGSTFIVRLPLAE